jgi:F-type H+-transporting ATPase subunit epsilon
MIHFSLVTLSGTKFGDNVHEVVLPTPEGQIAVFPDHMPLVTIATPGIIKVRVKAGDPDDFMKVYATNGGIIEITDNKVRVLVDEADSSDEINEKEAEKAHQEALELRKSAKDQVSLDKAQSLLDRSAVRLKVAELKRRKRH